MNKKQLKNINENPLAKFKNGEIQVDVRVSPTEETVWLSQNDIASIFETSQPNVSIHIKNILDDGELADSVYKDFLYTAEDGKQYKTKFYNLDMVLAIGYRVKSKRAIEFRKWVSNVMKDYIIKGYSLNRSRVSIDENNYHRLCSDVLKLADKVDEHETRINHLMPSSTLIYEGTTVSAYFILDLIISSTKNKLIIVDPYFDLTSLLLLKDLCKRASVNVVSSKRIKKDQEIINRFMDVYGSINFIFNEKIHDRFIIVDDEIIYQIGASINQIGTKFSTLNLIKEKQTKLSILKKINNLIN